MLRFVEQREISVRISLQGKSEYIFGGNSYLRFSIQKRYFINYLQVKERATLKVGICGIIRRVQPTRCNVSQFE